MCVFLFSFVFFMFLLPWGNRPFPHTQTQKNSLDSRWGMAATIRPNLKKVNFQTLRYGHYNRFETKVYLAGVEISFCYCFDIKKSLGLGLIISHFRTSKSVLFEVTEMTLKFKYYLTLLKYYN